jgi:excisionase family DNA binding protein
MTRRREQMQLTTTAVRHLDAHDVAERLRLPMWSVYQLVRRGELPHMRIGRRLRFRLADIEAWERRRTQGGR